MYRFVLVNLHDAFNIGRVLLVEAKQRIGIARALPFTGRFSFDKLQVPWTTRPRSPLFTIFFPAVYTIIMVAIPQSSV